MTFKKAERKQIKLKLAITGPSGSGKTYSALRLAKGLGGKTALIDTENGSASLYSDKFEFDVLELTPPFTTDKYIAAIQEAVKAGYAIVVIDSISHQWAGEGGLLDRKAKMDARPGSNSFANWNQMTPEHERFKSAILQSPIHVICTMRSKQEYILESNEKGKQAPKKVGLAPVQRDAMEYEFTVVFDLAMNHQAEVSKDRTGLFVDQLFMVTEASGEAIRDWIASGKVPDPEPPKAAAKVVAPMVDPVPPTGPTPAQLKRLFAISTTAGISHEEMKEILLKDYGHESSKELTAKEYEELCARLEAKTLHAAAAEPAYTPPPWEEQI